MPDTMNEKTENSENDASDRGSDVAASVPWLRATATALHRLRASKLLSQGCGDVITSPAIPHIAGSMCPAMKTGEVLLLKCYDWAAGGGARFAPHGPFLDPTAPRDAPLRESIELRAMMFHTA
jgi:hypothetical protein